MTHSRAAVTPAENAGATQRRGAKADVAIIGAGLIGLATTRALLIDKPRTRVVVLEKEPELARHQSGRNSGVIHAGIYYPPGSLKAKLCRDGRAELLRFADEHGIPYRRCGKVVVAVDESELGRLEELHRRGAANGARGLAWLTPDALAEHEPYVVGVRALHVPETAVIDFGAVTRALAHENERRGAMILLGRKVTAIESRADGHILRFGDERLEARRVVTCAGLQSDRVAALTGRASREHRITPFRGDFHALAPEARSFIRGIVYPVPDPSFPFLGVHFTRRIDDEVWAGPNAVPAFSREGYGRLSVSWRDTRDLIAFRGIWSLARRYYRTGAAEIWRDLVKRAAVREMRRYVPSLEPRHVRYATCGVRAQALARDGTLVDDFLLERDGGVLHVVNAPSPGATACLAIGRRLAKQLE